jgi:hypothetical protein
MNEVTRILSNIEQGDAHAAEQLLPLVYEELRKLAAQKLAQEKPGQTLQAAALVHEAYLRLVDVETAEHWNSRGHFFAAAAEAMRRILVDQARRKQADKRGGGVEQLPGILSEGAVLHQDLPQRPPLVADPLIHRVNETVLADELELQRENAEEQVPIRASVGHGSSGVGEVPGQDLRAVLHCEPAAMLREREPTGARRRAVHLRWRANLAVP